MAAPFSSRLATLLSRWPAPVLLRCTASSGGAPPNLFRFTVDEAGTAQGDRLDQFPTSGQRFYRGQLDPADVRFLLEALAAVDFEQTPKTAIDSRYLWVQVELDGQVAHLSAEQLPDPPSTAVHGAVARLRAALEQLPVG